MGREGPEIGSICRDLGHREDSGEGRGQWAEGVQDLLQSLYLKTRWNGCGHLVGGHMSGDLLSSHVPHWGFKRLQQFCDVSLHWSREPGCVAG